MTEINTETGVNEGVADPSVEEQSPAEVNWKLAQETMAQQKAEIENLKQGSQQYADQINLLKSYMSNQGMTKQEQKSFLDSIDSGDLVTGADLQKSIRERESQYQSEIAKLRNEMAILSMRAERPDYMEAVNRTLEMAKSDPELSRAIETSSNPQYLAYALGKQTNTPKSNPEVEKVLKQHESPGNPSRVPVGGKMSQADYYRSMSSEDFEAHIAKIKSAL